MRIDWEVTKIVGEVTSKDRLGVTEVVGEVTSKDRL